MKKKKHISTTLVEYLNEQRLIGVLENKEEKKLFINFLIDKKKVNEKSKNFFYHGTKIHPKDFVLRDDYDGEDSNNWSGELPEGYLFLTTSFEEASAYGQYIIPCELKKTDNLSFSINADNPSQVFDKDYGIDLFLPDEHFGFWEKFEESGKSILIIRGIKRMTLITPIDNVIPRTDLAEEFYKTKKGD